MQKTVLQVIWLATNQPGGMVRSGGEGANSEQDFWKFGKTGTSSHRSGQELERTIPSRLSRSPVDARSSKRYRHGLKSIR
jgi:hypothetical protein